MSSVKKKDEFVVLFKTQYFLNGWEKAVKDFNRFKRFVKLNGGKVLNSELGTYHENSTGFELCEFYTNVKWGSLTTKTRLNEYLSAGFHGEDSVIEVYDAEDFE